MTVVGETPGEETVGVAQERRTSPVELLWDLVFVFCITQVTTLLSSSLTWPGAGRAMLVLALVWWAWSAFVWATNAEAPGSWTVSAVLLPSTAFIFIAGIALPQAFGSEATLFAAAYAAVRVLHLVLYVDASRKGTASWSAIAGFAVTVVIGMALLLVGSFFADAVRLPLWGAAVLIDYAGPLLTRSRLRALQEVAVAHFAERYGLFVIIALGESIVAIGARTRIDVRHLTAGVVGSAALCLLLTVGLWWSYFGRFADAAESRLRAHAEPVLAASDAYSYLQLVVIAGIIIFAVGARLVIAGGGAGLGDSGRLALCGGVALYLGGLVLMSWRLLGSAPLVKVAAAIVLAAVGFFATGLPGWEAALIVACVLAAASGGELAVRQLAVSRPRSVSSRAAPALRYARGYMDLQSETTEVLQRLIRFNTVNPPGNERPALEYLASYVGEAGLDVELLGSSPERANLVATLAGVSEGPVLGLLGHVDTVLADPSEWTRDPWSGDLADGFVWGRGAIDMKSQVAAEAAAAVGLARSGWRPTRGQLKLLFVSDEETGGEFGAEWLTQNHPAKVRCDLLLNEGAGEVFEYRGRRLYGVCCGEKGILRFMVTARGAAGHASLPRMGENALLKLVPALSALGKSGIVYDVTGAVGAFLTGVGEDASDPATAVAHIGQAEPQLLPLIEPMLGVTITPTMVHASDKINVIPSRAYVKVDCRVPPGLGRDVAERRVSEALGGTRDGLEIEFTETEIGNCSPVGSPFMDAISAWIRDHDPGAATVPVILPGASDSRFFREAFPECVVYGFFPQRYMTMLESTPLVHGADERIDVRDLGFAAEFYSDIARAVLG